MRKNKNRSKIILATMVAVLATVISYSAFNAMNKKMGEQQKLIDLMQNTKVSMQKETYTYAIATKDLKAGEIVSDADVDFKEFDSKESGDFDNRANVINKILLKDISIGEAYTKSHIAKVSSDNVALKDGFRALTLPSSKFDGKSSKMGIGSTVDVLSVGKEDGWGLENVRIIELEGGNSSNISTADSITFEVPADEIVDFMSSSSKGNLLLVARKPSDAKTKRKKMKSAPVSYASLPNLPATVPIENMSGLPMPIQPEVSTPEVELIEANVKSKVTFD